MNDAYVTVVGNVVAEPRHAVTANGTHVANVRLASTSRRFDRERGQWRDTDTLFVGISCWRSLADNVAASIGKGDPVVVAGRLRMRSYTNKNGERRNTIEIDANVIGHDLSRGVSRFQKAGRYGGEGREEANSTEGPPATATDGPTAGMTDMAAESDPSDRGTPGHDSASQPAAADAQSWPPGSDLTSDGQAAA